MVRGSGAERVDGSTGALDAILNAATRNAMIIMARRKRSGKQRADGALSQFMRLEGAKVYHPTEQCMVPKLWRGLSCVYPIRKHQN